LQQTQAALEGEVQKRTEELTSKNELLQTEVIQRKHIEEALQTAKDELEMRVAERTNEQKSTNAQLQLELAERKRVEVQITASLREKELLLKEVHHRVKNNLQVISSLLYLQSDKIKDQQALDIFRDSQNRVRSMALIHEKLYQAKDLTRVDLAEYLHNLIGYLFRSYGTQAAAIRLQIQAEGVFLSIDTAMPCGLIINELVSNALKHAFASAVTVKIGANDNYVHLEVFDNGKGFDTDCLVKSGGMGLVNMRERTEELGGILTIDSYIGCGTTIKAIVPLDQL